MNKRLKKKKLRQRNRYLTTRFPFLIPRNIWTDTIPNNYDYSYTLLDSMPTGWRKAFGIQLLEELREELIKWNYLNQYRVVQIKEKYGQLRWYDNGAPYKSKIHKIIEAYSVISENVCMFCGRLDVPLTMGYWIYPSCKKCYHDKEAYENIIDMDNTQINESYSVRHYDGSETTEIFDISETVKKIRLKNKRRDNG